MPAPVTAARLAEVTEVSLRSLYRDVDSLRAAGARIEGERGYGYRLVEDYALPPQTFDRLEIEALVLGLEQVRSMGDPALGKAASSVLAKVAATLPDDREQHLLHAISQVYRPDMRPIPGNVALIREACWNEQAIFIHYADKAGAASERTVLPLAVMYTEGALTLLAWCCLREAFRIFRLERIAQAEVLSTSFRPRRAGLLREYLQELRRQADEK